MVLGKLPVPGRPTIWITVGQGPTALAVGAGGGCLDIFTLIYPFSPLSPSLWETARYRLKYCLKGPLNPKQPTNQPNHMPDPKGVVGLRRCWINFQCRGVLLVWMIVGQGSIALAVGAGGGCLDIISLVYLFSLPLWETARYRLKYCLEGPLNPKQPTNQRREKLSLQYAIRLAANQRNPAFKVTFSPQFLELYNSELHYGNIQKLISSSTPWSITICQISGSYPKQFFRYFVHKAVPIQNACV